MKFLIIGLGSMGKRRIRNLKSLGYTDIFGFDQREDRRLEAYSRYGIKTYASYEEAMDNNKFDAFIISVPPDTHHIYMKKAVLEKIHFFVEASVVDTDLDSLITGVCQSNIVAAPSSTFYFHPAIQKIRSIVNSGELGTISNIIYHAGQYLPDWHTYEGVEDYYVSKKETGGAREIVPFELTWIVSIFGLPVSVAGMNKKTIAIQGAETIDDTYNLLLDYDAFIFNLIVDVVSRLATRRLLINGDKKQLIWNWDDNNIRIFDPVKNEWHIEAYEMAGAEAGYNKNISEQYYIDEMNCFVSAIKGEATFVNTLEADRNVLHILYKAEAAYQNKIFQTIA